MGFRARDFEILLEIHIPISKGSRCLDCELPRLGFVKLAIVNIESDLVLFFYILDPGKVNSDDYVFFTDLPSSYRFSSLTNPDSKHPVRIEA